MKVFLAELFTSFEGSSNEGIFSSRELAEKYLEELNESRSCKYTIEREGEDVNEYAYYTVSEWELDDPRA